MRLDGRDVPGVLPHVRVSVLSLLFQFPIGRAYSRVNTLKLTQSEEAESASLKAAFKRRQLVRSDKTAGLYCTVSNELCVCVCRLFATLCRRGTGEYFMTHRNTHTMRSCMHTQHMHKHIQRKTSTVDGRWSTGEKTSTSEVEKWFLL